MYIYFKFKDILILKGILGETLLMSTCKGETPSATLTFYKREVHRSHFPTETQVQPVWPVTDSTNVTGTQN